MFGLRKRTVSTEEKRRSIHFETLQDFFFGYFFINCSIDYAEGTQLAIDDLWPPVYASKSCVPFNEAVYAACMRNFAFPSYALNITYAMQMPSHFYLMHRKI